MSYIEIYNEQVYDLLSNQMNNLQIVDNPISGPTVVNLEEVSIESMRQVAYFLEYGN